MIRRVLRAGLLGAVAAWAVDQVLARRAGGAAPPAVDSWVVIRAPIERVWTVIADVEAQPSWMRDLKAVRIEGHGPIGVGTRAEGDVRIFGLRVVDPITITAFEPPRRFSIRHEGTFSGEGDIRLDQGVDRATTLVHWSETLVPPALPYLGSRVLSPVLHRVFQADLERLRALVEADRPAG